MPGHDNYRDTTTPDRGRKGGRDNTADTPCDLMALSSDHVVSAQAATGQYEQRANEESYTLSKPINSLTAVRAAVYRSQYQQAMQVEVANALGISERTARRYWSAKLFSARDYM
jgi:response regulator of citrate/malate metabolism